MTNENISIYLNKAPRNNVEPVYAATTAHVDDLHRLRSALETAEAALSDIGDADREEYDDLEWCEKRAAQALPEVREALDQTYNLSNIWKGTIYYFQKTCQVLDRISDSLKDLNKSFR
jgi:hypothetical protein